MIPYLIFADREGKIYPHPYLRMAVSSPDTFRLPQKEELIRLPKGSSFFYLPQRAPLGFNQKKKRFEVLYEFKGRKVTALGAFLTPAYLRLYHPAASLIKRKVLPLWAYTAGGFYGGEFYAAAKRVDYRLRQSPRFYNPRLVKRETRHLLRTYPRNRLLKHLANCALNYNCLAAKNLFLKRWEAPLPVARFCNARCLGCLSYQEADCAPSHKRIYFKPKTEEVVEIMGAHLSKAREPIVSFGQGCEGEPLRETDLISRSIELVRGKISRGTINMNTNASIPSKIKLLCEAGIDSFRVSLNSAQEKFYNIYFRPVNYKFKDVLRSIEIAKKYSKFVAINLFVFPGFSDSQQEIKALIKLIRTTGVDMIQWRNLNIDPALYLENILPARLKPEGVLSLLKIIKEAFPYLKHGYFNLPKEKFYRHNKS